ncbi:MAG: hypothetical protein ABI679_09485 [Gemmatimonadota bacterium]
MDILLAWYPTNFGDLEWKFGTVTTTLNSFPLISLGLILLTVSALARGRRRLMATMTIILFLVVILLLFCAALYLPQVPKALGSVTDLTVKMGLKRAVAKTAVQLVMYPVVLGWIAVKSLKQWRTL